MKFIQLIAVSVTTTCLSFAACAQGKPAAKDAVLYFVWPQNGASIKGGFWCRFGLRNMGVTHAGDNFQNSGHHHLLIDEASRSSRTNRLHKTSRIFILEQVKQRRALNFHPVNIRFNSCLATPITIHSALR
jgi:hypothetical protein